MNRSLMILPLVALSAAACAQHVNPADVPRPVNAAFAKQFPKAEKARWGMESKTEYEVEFKQGAESMSATYAADGQWLETEKKIKLEALPEAVRHTLATRYAGHKTEDISLVKNPKGTFYEADIEKGETSMEVLFSADGVVLKEQVEERDNDQDEHGD